MSVWVCVRRALIGVRTLGSCLHVKQHMHAWPSLVKRRTHAETLSFLRMLCSDMCIHPPCSSSSALAHVVAFEVEQIALFVIPSPSGIISYSWQGSSQPNAE